MTKREILTRLGINQAGMAEIFGLTRAAITKWPEDEEIPRGRWFELKYSKHPGVFDDIEDPPKPTKDGPQPDDSEAA